MKIPSLLAQYLYCHQRLDLPGIGSFVLDSSSVSALENSKQRQAILDGVSFNFNPSLQETSGLVAFIAEKTGKMKPLATSSYWLRRTITSAAHVDARLSSEMNDESAINLVSTPEA